MGEHILHKGKLKDGTTIQLEDWSKEYTFMTYGSSVATYPIAKVTCEGDFSPKKGKTFRCMFEFDNYEEALQAYNALIKGNKNLRYYKEFLREKQYADCI